MKIETKDCKEWLVNRYPDTKLENWKRVSKYLDDGVVTREFKNLEKCVVIQEIGSELVEKKQLLKKDKNPNILNVKKILELNRNLHYINDENLVKIEFNKFSKEGEIFKKLEKEILDCDDYKYDLPYSLEKSSLMNWIQKKLIPSFVFCIYEVYSGETSMQISDIYGLCGGDGGQTVSLILNGENGLVQYLESKGYQISGESETAITVETENHAKLTKALESFGLLKFNNKIHTDAYITQESIEKESPKKIKFR